MPGLLNPCATSLSTPSSRGVGIVMASPDTGTRACLSAASPTGCGGRSVRGTVDDPAAMTGGNGSEGDR